MSETSYWFFYNLICLCWEIVQHWIGKVLMVLVKVFIVLLYPFIYKVVSKVYPIFFFLPMCTSCTYYSVAHFNGWQIRLKCIAIKLNEFIYKCCMYITFALVFNGRYLCYPELCNNGSFKSFCRNFVHINLYFINPLWIYVLSLSVF